VTLHAGPPDCRSSSLPLGLILIRMLRVTDQTRRLARTRPVLDRTKAVRYIRVSGAAQSALLQADETARLIDERGWQLVETYMERATSGSSAHRPESARLMDDARRSAFDVVVVWRADRLFEGTKSMVAAVDELIALGIGLVSVTESFDTLPPHGHHFKRLISAMADLERQVFAERTRSGLDAARAEAHG
jgi:DNA invertase Pin-like site-specific DNA recombinase